MQANTALTERISSGAGFVIWLLRIVSMVLLAFSTGYWAKLTGIADNNIRFDTISTEWKVAATTLVVLQPVASLGLWGGWRWGVVLWIFIAIIEVTMYGVYSDIFGQASWIIVFHTFALAVYLSMALLFAYWNKPDDD